jgi:tetratricopeptide (TPR) repeat protein
MVVAAQNDSICISNSSVSHEFVKAGNYKDAYLPWKVVIGTCPTLRYYTFTDGFSILKSFLATNTDRSSADYKKYFDELMDLHDARIKYIPEFLSKGTRITLTTDGALATKAIDYIQFAPSVDVNTAYSWLSQSVNAEQEKSSANALNFFLDMSGQKLKGDDTHKEQFIKDYMLSTQLADAAIASATKETTKTSYETVRSNLDAQFINSGVATCESLENIYAPKVEASKDNLDALKDIIKVMDMMGCRDNDAYQKASLYAYQIEPSADAALGCAAMAFKKGDISGAVKFFDEALKLEDDSNKKAETAYKAAVVLASKKQLSQARSYAQKAISYKENYGAPYILIATLYAGNYKWSDEPILNKCTFWAAIDKLQRAKSVDSSCTEEANKLIGQYSAYTPESKDLFMLGYKSGDRIAIGGWIGETVTVR